MTGKNNRVKSTNDIELKDRLVAINRVTKVTKGGRTFSFSAIVVVGNEAGIVGWGLGKASEVTTAIAKEKSRESSGAQRYYPSRSIGKIRWSSRIYQARFSGYWSKGRWCYACRS